MTTELARLNTIATASIATTQQKAALELHGVAEWALSILTLGIYAAVRKYQNSQTLDKMHHLMLAGMKPEHRQADGKTTIECGFEHEGSECRVTWEYDRNSGKLNVKVEHNGENVTTGSDLSAAEFDARFRDLSAEALRYRAEHRSQDNPCILGLDLTGANLKGVDLSGVDLSGADLSGAKLDGANLSRMNLSGAKLDGANLSGANLFGANLFGANLKEANLKKANLKAANLFGVNLTVTNLTGAKLEGANLTNADLAGANLTVTNLTGANLKEANLKKANLKAANLFEANLYGANLEGANLSHAVLSNASLVGANLSDADLSGAYHRQNDGTGVFVTPDWLEMQGVTSRTNAIFCEV